MFRSNLNLFSTVRIVRIVREVSEFKHFENLSHNKNALLRGKNLQVSISLIISIVVGNARDSTVHKLKNSPVNKTNCEKEKPTTDIAKNSIDTKKYSL